MADGSIAGGWWLIRLPVRPGARGALTGLRRFCARSQKDALRATPSGAGACRRAAQGPRLVLRVFRGIVRGPAASDVPEATGSLLPRERSELVEEPFEIVEFEIRPVRLARAAAQLLEQLTRAFHDGCVGDAGRIAVDGPIA